MKTALDLVAAAKAHITEVGLSEAPELIREADWLLDVREPDEYKAGHLSGAVNIPRGLLEFKMAEPGLESRDLAIVLYCKTSGRAALAALALQSLGYHRVHSIAGGYDAWVEAGLPVVQPALPEFG